MAVKRKIGTVLMYNCSGPEYSKLRQIFAMLRIRMHPIAPERYHVALNELVDGKGEPVAEGEAPEAFEERMLVFCHMHQLMLHRVLEVIRLAELPPIQLKAVLTESNQTWDSVQLREELLRERETIAEQVQAERAKKAEAEKAEADKAEQSGEAEAEPAEAAEEPKETETK